MAVLIEAISVVVRKDSIARSFSGGWGAFAEVVPNATLCADDEITRVGFMDPNSVQNFVECLQNGGLTFVADGSSVDFAVVDQQKGLTIECDWLEVARVPFGDTGSVMAAWLWDKPRIAHGVHMSEGGIELHTPPGWIFEGSLSQKFTFVPNEDAEERLRFVRSEDGVDVFEDIETGKEFYVANDNPTPE